LAPEQKDNKMHANVAGWYCAAIAAALLPPRLHAGQGATEAPADLDRHNVVWTQPSRNAAGSMPLGNGELGLNVWIEEGGDLLCYLARTDAWSETSRLLKLGRIRVSLLPNPFAAGQPFRQELRLRDGCIAIAAGPPALGLKLTVLVDAEAPVVHVLGESRQPVEVRASFEFWRTNKATLRGEELQSSWTMQNAPANVPVWESADVLDDAIIDQVGWYHRNAYSVVPVTLKHQGLGQVANLAKDPIALRVFGGRMEGAGLIREGPAVLRTPKAIKNFDIRIATHSAQAEAVSDWSQELDRIAAASANGKRSEKRTAEWWRAFWNRSWILVDGEGDAAATTPRVTAAWVLQRFMAAAAGRGQYPIKFNGSIFTVDPEFTGGPKFNADWRRWGDCYWWQNTRLPYFPMLACGDLDGPPTLFRLYREVLPLCAARARLYYGAEGAYFPETMTAFGTYPNGDYGWDRTGHKPSEVLCPWWCHAWQQGLELLQLMLDYADYTDSAPFVAQELLPMARQVLRYFDTRFGRDAQGQLVISPTQAVETYWHQVTNDTPTVAGLNAVLDRLLALPPAQLAASDREAWTRLKTATPPLPLGTESARTFVQPAATFKPERSNIENPELYAVWPFRLLRIGRPDLETGIETYRRRGQKTTQGWSYDGQCAALLGLVDEARQQIEAKITNSNPGHRFPAMWGPNHDWLPDQDHGSNILLTLQSMLLQADGNEIHLLPAWPKEWNVRFRLHAPHRTVVECEYRGGRVVRLAVTPSTRLKDVVNHRAE
jgi:hypothetical protein